MTLRQVPHRWSSEQFVDWESAQETRFEFVGGIVYAMVGATARHARIVRNVAAALRLGLDASRCEVFTESFKLVVPTADDLVAYPDVMVVCAPTEPDAISTSEPAILFEVTSPDSQSRDLEEKSALYAAIPSLRHYAVVRHNRPAIEHFSRGTDGAFRRETLVGAATALVLPDFDLSLPFATVYANTDLRA